MIRRSLILAALIAAVSPAAHSAWAGTTVHPAPIAGSGAIQLADQKDGLKQRQKRERGWDKRQREYERERAKDRRERDREARKHREEMLREEQKHREEMWREESRHREEMRRGSRRYGYRSGPPPWAPAHGYRREHQPRFKYRRHGRERYATVLDIVHVPTSGFGTCNREVVGGLLGAAAGGLLGSKIGSGSGKTAAVIGGTIIGALVGGNIGRGMDQVDQNCVGQVLERVPTGRPVVWQNPDGPGQYQVTPTDTYQRSDGRYCREYQTEIIVGGRVEQGYGTACRQPDGSWEKVS